MPYRFERYKAPIHNNIVFANMQDLTAHFRHRHLNSKGELVLSKPLPHDEKSLITAHYSYEGPLIGEDSDETFEAQQPMELSEGTT